MSPALIHGRVDRWLASRASWVNASPRRRALADAWHECAVKYGADHPAARGVLTEIVRDAWGLPGAHVVAIAERSDDVAYQVRHSLERPEGWMFVGPDARGLIRERIVGGAAAENAVLVAALEAAP